MRKTAFLASLAVVAVSLFGATAFAQTAWISKDGLKAQLGNPDLIVIDVRAAHDWDGSHWKIKGAAREDGLKFDSWKDKYPKDKIVVLYCA